MSLRYGPVTINGESEDCAILEVNSFSVARARELELVDGQAFFDLVHHLGYITQAQLDRQRSKMAVAADKWMSPSDLAVICQQYCIPRAPLLPLVIEEYPGPKWLRTQQWSFYSSLLAAKFEDGDTAVAVRSAVAAPTPGLIIPPNPPTQPVAAPMPLFAAESEDEDEDEPEPAPAKSSSVPAAAADDTSDSDDDEPSTPLTPPIKTATTATASKQPSKSATPSTAIAQPAQPSKKRKRDSQAEPEPTTVEIKVRKIDQFPLLDLEPQPNGSYSRATFYTVLAAAGMQGRCKVPDCDCYAHALVVVHAGYDGPGFFDLHSPTSMLPELFPLCKSGKMTESMAFHLAGLFSCAE